MLGNQHPSKDEESLSLASIVLFLSDAEHACLACFLSLACLPGVPPEQEQNVALSGKQILLAGLTYYSCEASLACPLSIARLAWRACLACSLSLACLLGVLSEPVRVSNEGLWMRLMLGNTTSCCGTQ